MTRQLARRHCLRYGTFAEDDVSAQHGIGSCRQQCQVNGALHQHADGWVEDGRVAGVLLERPAMLVGKRPLLLPDKNGFFGAVIHLV